MAESRPSFWKRLKRPRLSVRALMLAVLIVGLLCGMWIASARRQAQMVAKIKRWSGSVYYEWETKYETDEIRGVFPPPQPVTDWLIQKLGPDAVGNVTAVHLRIPSALRPIPDEADWARINEEVTTCAGEFSHLEGFTIPAPSYFTDDHLAHLAGLKHIRGLYLEKTRLDGKSLRHLKGMKRLELLNLWGIPVRDQDLANLSGLTNLKTLVISGELVTDEGLEHLSRLTQLTTLHIGNTGRSPMAITSRGLTYLAGNAQMEDLMIGASQIVSLEPLRSMDGLKKLHMNDASITDQGLATLHQGFDNLTRLILPGNPAITDAGLAHLTGLKNLERLDLSGASITGPGLAHLESLSRLTWLDLRYSSISDRGIATLDTRSKIFTKNTMTIELENTAITDVGLTRLLGISTPNSVWVSGTKTTPEGLKQLENQYGTNKLVSKKFPGGWRPR